MPIDQLVLLLALVHRRTLEIAGCAVNQKNPYLHPIVSRGSDPIKRMDFTSVKGVDGGSATGGNRHFLIDEIDSDEHFGYWLDRIRAMPETFIGDVCDSAQNLGAQKVEVDAARDFLLRRKNELREIIKANRQEFTGIANWTFLT